MLILSHINCLLFTKKILRCSPVARIHRTYGMTLHLRGEAVSCLPIMSAGRLTRQVGETLPASSSNPHSAISHNILLRYRSRCQDDIFPRIELIPSFVLSSDNTNCKNDIQLFHQLFDELSVHTDYH